MRLILKGVMKTKGGRMWIGFSWLRMGQVQAFVNLIMNLGVPKRKGNLFISSVTCQVVKNPVLWS
jgi:hypothetical protein